MKKEYKKDVEEIIGKIRCPKDFKCYKSGFNILCRARDIGIESFVECLEKKPDKCNFSLPFGLMHLCECPIRVYLAKKKQ
jgi:hypothetical protein